jgi:DNA invertase Pin-like site-specific DNA recombinase
MNPPPKLRCAVYTRKSSEEGLDQAFNSLHAQREACEAFVKSQAGEGWALRKERYDDGGYSGGSMDRPGLRRLLADIAHQKVDVVVVYKVDRLTRSLTDFARIIDAFDKAGVSFVSITQAFNTTTSMGRLTLNVLLSFAQFEREVTGERIRDKIAASKAKGMWMGGLPPLGYDPPRGQVSRALVVNEDEARSVRHIFGRFLEAGSLLALQRALQQEGIRSKRWVTAAGRRIGGHNFSRGALRHLLMNRVYLGEIGHKGQRFPGKHAAILDEQTFDAAQSILAHGSQAKRSRVPRAHTFPLYRLVFDSDGHPMEPVIANRRGKQPYRYYASNGGSGGDDAAIHRVPASAVESLATDRIAVLIGVSPADLETVDIRTLLARLEVHSTTVHLLLRVGASIAGGARVTLERLRRAAQPGYQLRVEPTDTRLIRVVLPVRLKVRGGRTWSTNLDGSQCPPPKQPDAFLIEKLRTAHSLLRACGAQPEAVLTELRYAHAPKNSHQARLARWAFLAPDIQDAILNGRIRGLADKPIADIPLSWAEQRRRFGASVGSDSSQ